MHHVGDHVTLVAILALCAASISLCAKEKDFVINFSTYFAIVGSLSALNIGFAWSDVRSSPPGYSAVCTAEMCYFIALLIHFTYSFLSYLAWMDGWLLIWRHSCDKAEMVFCWPAGCGIELRSGCGDCRSELPPFVLPQRASSCVRQRCC